MAAAVVAGWKTEMESSSRLSSSQSKLVMSAADLFRGRDLWMGGLADEVKAGT